MVKVLKKTIKKTLTATTYTSGVLQTFPNTTVTFPSTPSFYNYSSPTLPNIQIFGEIVVFNFKKGNYCMPLKQVKEYGYKISIITAYIKAEKTGWFSSGALATKWSVSPINIFHTITPSPTTTINTLSWATSGVGYTI